METLLDDWDDRDDRRLSQKSSLFPQLLAHALHFKMVAQNTELNTSLFMEEEQKYPAIYNKFC